MESEYGLVVCYSGKDYQVFIDDKCYEYPIGGLICEYSRFKPASLKDVIMKCPVFDKEVNDETISESAEWFYSALFDEYDPIISVMITTDMSDYIHDFLWGEGYKEKYLNELNESLKTEQIEQYILEGSGFDKYNIDTIGGLYLSAYAQFAQAYIVFRYSFNILAEGRGRENDVNVFLSLFGENIKMQHINYKIALVEGGKFVEFYTIKSSLSLLLFETAHIMDSDRQIVKCKNCGEYFAPAGRLDTIYCSYPSPQDSGKTCKDIGAQVSRSNKEKTDIATKEYRKTYMRFKMLSRRHPDKKEYEEMLNKLTSEAKDWRNNLSNGTTTTEEYLEWLSGFSEKDAD